MLYELGANDGQDRSVTVLPADNLAVQQPWLLKLHGDFDHVHLITLSRRDFIRYDSDHGPAGAVFQALLLSRHMMIVGASLTDDNILRLAYEVDDFVKARTPKAGALGTVVTHEPQRVRQRLFEGIFDYVDTSCGHCGAEGARDLAIFLDAVAHYATHKSSFLLDPKYRELLDESGRQLADDLQPIITRINTEGRKVDGPWQELAQQLSTFGATSRRAEGD